MAEHSGYRAGIARIAGKVFVALGFILGTFGLTEGRRRLLETGLGLLVAGVLASAYGVYHSVRNRDISPDPGTPKS